MWGQKAPSKHENGGKKRPQNHKVWAESASAQIRAEKVWGQKVPSKCKSGGKKRHQNSKVTAKSATTQISEKKVMVAESAIKMEKWWRKTPLKQQSDQYLLNQGWDKKTFWECEDKNNLGIDICIRHTHSPSTHGAMSRVMTVAEKYVWCVKHHMEAAFASQLQYNDYGQGIRYISDYYEIDDFTNTYQDYVNSRHTKMEDKWIHTDQMVVTPYEEFSIENIEKWMKQADVPDFAAWFDRKTDTEILYAFTNIVNELLGIEEAVWISSGIVKRDGFQKFIEALDVYAEDRAELLNVSDFHSYIETSGFYTPQEICAVQTAKETNDIINIGEQENNVQVYKLITTCLSAHDEDTEMSFYLPSGIARKITGITYGDGYEYINENNEVDLYTTSFRGSP